MRRDAARSAGPKLMPCIRGEAVAISSRFTTPSEVSRMAWTRIGRLRPAARLELGQQAVDVVDVPRALDLGDHDHLEAVADLGHQRRDVVERPRRLERVDAGPQRRAAEVHLLAHAHEAGPRRLLVLDRDGVLEVAEEDIGLRGQVGQLADDLLVGGVEEVDHPRRRDRDLERRIGGADGEGLGEVAWVSHAPATLQTGFARGRGSSAARQALLRAARRAGTRRSRPPAAGRSGGRRRRRVWRG